MLCNIALSLIVPPAYSSMTSYLPSKFQGTKNSIIFQDPSTGMKISRCDAKLTRPEVIGLRLYTGPAFMAINSALRERRAKLGKRKCTPDCKKKHGEQCSNCAPGSDCFVTTIAVINSGITKLGKVTPLVPMGKNGRRKLFRGISNRALPEYLLRLPYGSLQWRWFQEQNHKDRERFSSWTFSLLEKGLGLKWQDMWQNMGPTRPTEGRELSNSKLVSAIKRNTKIVKEDLDASGVTDLRSTDYIKVGDSYFEPSSMELKFEQNSWDVAAASVVQKNTFILNFVKEILLKTPWLGVIVHSIQMSGEVEGLCWKEFQLAGSSELQIGAEIKNEKLAQALKQKHQYAGVKFTRQELDSFNLHALSRDSHIRVGHKYFKPAMHDVANSDEPESDKILAQKRSEATIKKLKSMGCTNAMIISGEVGLKMATQFTFSEFDDDSLKPEMCSFVEYAFSSASPDEEVARGYASQGGGSLLEIDTGQIDRGATLKWVSQFPAENEHVILPLSNFEITGMRREGHLNIYSTKLNLNLKAQTLEDLRDSRKTALIDFGKALSLEARQLLSGYTGFEQPQQEIEETLLHEIRVQDPHYFSDAQNFRSAFNKLFDDWRSVLLLAAHRLCDEAEILYYSHGDDTKVRKAAMKAISIFKRINLPCVPSSITRRQGCSEIDHALDGGMLQVYGRLRVLCHLVTVTIEQGASFDSFEVILDAYSNLSQSNCKEDIDAALECFKHVIDSFGEPLPIHPKVLATLNTKGTLLAKRGQLCEAQGLIQESFESFKEALTCFDDAHSLHRDPAVPLQHQVRKSMILQNLGVLLYKHLGNPQVLDSKKTFVLASQQILKEALRIQVTELRHVVSRTTFASKQADEIASTLFHLKQASPEVRVTERTSSSASQQTLSRVQSLCSRICTRLDNANGGLECDVLGILTDTDTSHCQMGWSRRWTPTNVSVRLNDRSKFGLHAIDTHISEWGAAALERLIVDGHHFQAIYASDAFAPDSLGAGPGVSADALYACEICLKNELWRDEGNLYKGHWYCLSCFDELCNMVVQKPELKSTLKVKALFSSAKAGESVTDPELVKTLNAVGACPNGYSWIAKTVDGELRYNCSAGGHWVTKVMIKQAAETAAAEAAISKASARGRFKKAINTVVAVTYMSSSSATQTLTSRAIRSVRVGGVTGVFAANSNGVYHPIAGETCGGRPVYKKEGEDVWIEYWPDQERWQVKPGASRGTDKCFMQSEGGEEAGAVEDVTGIWEVRTDYDSGKEFSVQERVRVIRKVSVVQISGVTRIKVAEKALGLKWHKAGDTQSTMSLSLEHIKLAEALKSKTVFTQQEWEAFGIKDLRPEHIIYSGYSYFQPAVTGVFSDVNGVYHPIAGETCGGRPVYKKEGEDVWIEYWPDQERWQVKPGPGLSWESVGKAKPTTGIEIHNRRLESALAQGQEEQANKAEIAHRLKQAGGKTGAINIFLMWDNQGSRADLDIHVKCPQGTISYQSTHVGQGAIDIDMQANRQGACIENVYWESPDTGQFKISVNNYQCPQGFVMPFKVSINTKVPVTLMDEQGKGIHENFVGFKTFEGKAKKDETVNVFGLCVENEQKRREALIALKSQEARNAERVVQFTKDELDAFQLSSLSYSTYIKVGDSYFKPISRTSRGTDKCFMQSEGGEKAEAVEDVTGRWEVRNDYDSRKAETEAKRKQQEEGATQKAAAEDKVRTQRPACTTTDSALDPQGQKPKSTHICTHKNTHKYGHTYIKTSSFVRARVCICVHTYMQVAHNQGCDTTHIHTYIHTLAARCRMVATRHIYTSICKYMWKDKDKETDNLQSCRNRDLCS